jgi:hypothetical protein
MAVVRSLSWTAWLFGGPLAGQVGLGLSFTLLAAAANMALMAALATLPGTAGGSQSLRCWTAGV